MREAEGKTGSIPVGATTIRPISRAFLFAVSRNGHGLVTAISGNADCGPNKGLP